MRFGTFRNYRRLLGAVCLGIGVLVVASLSAGAAMDNVPESGRVGAMLESLGSVLTRLEAALSGLDSPRAERLEEALKAVGETIDDLLVFADELGEVPEAGKQRRLRLTQLDRHLHRVLSLVEDVVSSAARTVERERAEERLEELRVWLDSVVFDASIGMSAEEYEQLESAVYQTARRLGLRMMQMPQPEDVTPVLSALMERLQEKLRQLDRLLLRIP